MALLWLDGFEDYDLPTQGSLYYNTHQLADPVGLVSRSGKGAQGGASLTFVGGLQPTLTMGYAFMTNILDAGFWLPLMNFKNEPSNFYFGLTGYNDVATAVATVSSDGEHMVITITHGGSYYDAIPEVTLQNTIPGGTYDHLDITIGNVADLDEGNVISIAVIGATGYTHGHNPLVIIAPGGLGFQARAVMEGSIFLGGASEKYVKAGQWNYLEFSANTSAAQDVFTGLWYSDVSYKLTVNGVTFLNSTLTSPEGHNAELLFASAEFQANRGIIDDLYITDGEFLCDGLFDNGNQGIRVLTLLPNGVGTYSNLTASDPTKPNWTMVKERVPDNDASYVASGAATGIIFGEDVPIQDTYVLQQLPATTREIRGIQADFIVKKTRAGPCTFQGVRADATDTFGQAVVMGTWNPSLGSYSGFYAPMRYHNADVEWTLTQVNDLELGLRKS